MDDNHYLVEWLAYHYHSLPLRRLIVASDPRSRTSPSTILNRYRGRGLMDVTEWDDDDYMPFDLIRKRDRMAYKRKNKTKNLVGWHRDRQRYFNLACLQQLQNEHRSWTLLLDSDEYLVLNTNASQSHQIRTKRNETAWQMLNMPENRNISEMMSSACISLPRLRFGTREMSMEGNGASFRVLPNDFNTSSLNTLRWQLRAESGKRNIHRPRKTMIDISRVDHNFLNFTENGGNPHAPVKQVCGDNPYPRTDVSPFVAHHYVGTYEQFAFRNDSRNWARSPETYAEFASDEHAEVLDTSATHWLASFVEQQGVDLAEALLEGAGELAEV